MNLKLRICFIFTLILSLVMVLGAWMMLQNARDDIRAEVDSTTTLALHVLDSEITQYAARYGGTFSEQKADLPLFRFHGLDNIRHLRVEFFDAMGQLRGRNITPSIAVEKSPPAWFGALIKSFSSVPKPTRRPIMVNENQVGELVVTPDPTYEIAEIWNDTYGLLGLGFFFFILVNGVLFWAVESALKPVVTIRNALTELEHGKLETRLPMFSLPELSGISHKFNAMAETLQKTIQRNQHLTKQLVEVQEDERKAIAQDLHDEIGQHLTAISYDATTILKAQEIAHAKQSAQAISEVVTQMIVMVREMLQRLRPATLDELGFIPSLQEMVDTWRQRNALVDVQLQITGDMTQMPGTIAITAYRIVQEALTNIARHTEATAVIINLKLDNSLMLQIQDNGKGFLSEKVITGFGLKGMRERVEALSGIFHVDSIPEKGVTLSIQLPITIGELS